MYDGDSFFTLAPGAAAGLLALSAVLGAFWLWLAWALARRRRVLTRLLLWAGLFTVFLWLSPQIYYAYYQAVLEGLPAQWVIGPWPDPGAALQILSFRANPSIANHARAGLAIAMLIATLVAGLDRRRTPTHQRSDGDQQERPGR